MSTENTVTVSEEPTAAPVIKIDTPTRADLKQKGWSAKEMDSAEKHGMIEKSDVKPEDKKPDEKTPEAKKPDVVPPEVKPLEKKLDTSLPDFTFKTPEQEKAFLDAFGQGTPQRAMYFRMKNERLARQRAEAERDRASLELQMEREKNIIPFKATPEVDDDGNPIDPEDKPLTMKQLKAMQKEEQDSINRQQIELNERSSKVAGAMKEQEDFAKETLPDFDDTVKLATDLVNNIEQIPELWKKQKIVKLLKDLQTTAATADKYGVEDYTASMIAYELGQLHPNYGKAKPPADPNGADPKAHGSQLTPEQMKRIEENTQRRASSASLPGSNGRRIISVEDVTVKDILRMTPEERFKFKKDHPEKMRKLLRG